MRTFEQHLAELQARLRRLENLNPELSVVDRDRLLELAALVGERGFDWTAKQFRRLLELYCQTPTKRYGQETLQEYFQELEHHAQLLIATGEITPLPEEKAQARSMHSLSSALVPYDGLKYSILDRCRLLNRAQISPLLSRAVDAFRRRLEVVDTVLEITFRIMWREAPEKAEAWLLAYLRENDGALDPDVIREFLLVLSDSRQLRRETLSWIETWCGDSSLLEYWPLVVCYGDKLLCRQALRQWQRQASIRSSVLAHLNFLIQRELLDDGHLLKWLSAALQNLGECVQRFVLLEWSDQEEEEWLPCTLWAELNRISALYHPVLLVSDQLLRQPDGANQLAMALLGLVGRGLREWEDKILRLAEKIVHRTFLYDLRERRKPLETIRRLTFGDQIAFNLACAELDLVSGCFDSLAQRDKITAFLAAFYASYRRGPLLAAEVARRYRFLMRILHEDYIANILAPEQRRTLQQHGILREISGVISGARHFLDRRRALQSSLEEMVASELEFGQHIRQRRLMLIRELLDAAKPSDKSETT